MSTELKQTDPIARFTLSWHGEYDRPLFVLDANGDWMPWHQAVERLAAFAGDQGLDKSIPYSLVRYGVQWNSGSKPFLTPTSDGYWTDAQVVERLAESFVELGRPPGEITVGGGVSRDAELVSSPDVAELPLSSRSFTLLQVQRLYASATLPKRGSPGAAGLDLFASASATLLPGGRQLVPTGIALAIAPGLYGRIAPRSGLALNQCIDVAAGVVDSDFRGEIAALLVNNGKEPFRVGRGMRIAQLILERCVMFSEPLEWSASLPDSARGSDGWGSTGSD